MTTRSQLKFSTERAGAVAAIASIAAGRGWCNVVPEVTEEAEDLTMSVFGLWVSKGVTVASFVTAAPRRGEAQPSSLGLLHTRGRLGRERIAEMLGDATMRVRQDHSQRGLLLDVAADEKPTTVLEVMCRLTSSLCDYELTGIWRLDLFARD
jgi:hypothetical protein